MDAPPVQYVKTSDGYDIAYGVCGEGIPLVRVPSVFSHFTLQWNRGVLESEFRAESDHFRLVLMDCRGQGSSTRGLTEATSLDDYVRDLEALVDHLRLERFVLRASSAMGKIAVKYAVKHPHRVIALVLSQYTEVSHGTRLGLFELAERDWPMLIQASARVGWTWADPAVVAKILHDSTTQADFLRLGAALSAEPGDEMLRALRVPTLVWGVREETRPMGRDQEAKRIAAIIPNARLVIFDDLTGGFSHETGGPPPAIATIRSLLEQLSAAGGGSASPQPPSKLSDREVEVLRLLAAGRSNQQIADELFISINTVIRHVANIFDKTGAVNRAQAAVYAKERDLLPGKSASHAGLRTHESMSRRELEVLRLIAEGRSNQQIADELMISIRTVERHINHIYEKIEVHSKAQATAYAKDHGLA
jgi:DNA-binding NarL/FixJ family response regulator/pimeloyl-ACP methyl ester carboxylesterase